MDASPIKDLEGRVTAWAEAQPNIRAILVVGSRARRDHPGDEWADLDLMLFATDFSPYLSSADWLDAIGTVWVCVPHQTGDGDSERLVLFDGGYKADFVFYPLDELRRMVEAQSMPGVYHRGYYVVVDKDRLAARLPACPFAPPPYARPSAAQFTRTVNSFWYSAVFIAKQIRRRQLWPVKYSDWIMKGVLLEMIEWHARAMHGWDHDTWHNGKFLAEWTDADTWQALHEVWGYFDAADSWRALFANMSLFRRLTTEAATRLDYAYPTLLDERVTQFVQRLHEEDQP